MGTKWLCSFFADIRAQVLATDKSVGAEIDFKYAHLGTLLGVAISMGFPVLKICMIWKHLSDQDSAGQRNTVPGFTGEGPGTPLHSILLRWSVAVRFLTLAKHPSNNLQRGRV
ncbi:hypothetical protein H920_04618 [Fukomys damarensis]|uniref:Uncharacterized protein n=1 Tax=Fukomys damarensis TaxID=885580 RepID=A0A091DSA0_FUKDA|nr:hypothetical protein H920_04618 [Fukomys damarensis]